MSDSFHNITILIYKYIIADNAIGGFKAELKAGFRAKLEVESFFNLLISLSIMDKALVIIFKGVKEVT